VQMTIDFEGSRNQCAKTIKESFHNCLCGKMRKLVNLWM
jgi:hypothetical protein